VICLLEAQSAQSVVDDLHTMTSFSHHTHITIVSSHRIDTAEGSIASPVHHVDYPNEDHDKHNQDNNHWNSQLDNLH